MSSETVNDPIETQLVIRTLRRFYWAILLCCIGLIGGLAAIWMLVNPPDWVATLSGKRAVRHDIASGHYAFYCLVPGPFPRSSEWDEWEAVKAEYGIEIRPLRIGCVPMPGRLDTPYADGYNSVAIPAIEKKLGKDVFDAAQARADRMGGLR